MFTRREVLAGASAMGLSAVTKPSAGRGRATAPEISPRPVLLIDLDDLGREYLEAAMASGGAPNLLRASLLGRNYQTFWAAPNCSVFRGRLLTGLDSYRSGNLIGRIVKPTDSFAGPTGLWLPAGLPGQKVQIGKWHMSAGASFPANLIANGFDRFDGMLGNLQFGGGTYYAWEEWHADAGGTSVSTQFTHNTTRIAQLALNELTLGTELVKVSFNAIHVPIEQPPNNEPPGKVYVGTTEAEMKANMLFHLDYWVGALIAAATKGGYVVFIVCDNGTDGEGKGTYYEDGCNTNLFVLGSGVASGLSSRLVQATDLWATVRRLRGDPLTTVAADSVDFADDFLVVPQIHTPRQFLTVDWFPYLGLVPPPTKWSRMIRDSRWKLVKQKIAPNATLTQVVNALFDLLNDPEEQVNLLDAPLSPEAQAAYDLLLANLPT